LVVASRERSRDKEPFERAVVGAMRLISRLPPGCVLLFPGGRFGHTGYAIILTNSLTLVCRHPETRQSALIFKA